MRIIIDCDQQHYAAAVAVVDRALPGWRDNYPRVGWGDHYGRRGMRFFIRRIKDGLSITQVDPDRIDAGSPALETNDG